MFEEKLLIIFVLLQMTPEMLEFNFFGQREREKFKKKREFATLTKKKKKDREAVDSGNPRICHVKVGPLYIYSKVKSGDSLQRYLNFEGRNTLRLQAEEKDSIQGMYLLFITFCNDFPVNFISKS